MPKLNDLKMKGKKIINVDHNNPKSNSATKKNKEKGLLGKRSSILSPTDIDTKGDTFNQKGDTKKREKVYLATGINLKVFCYFIEHLKDVEELITTSLTKRLISDSIGESIVNTRGSILRLTKRNMISLLNEQSIGRGQHVQYKLNKDYYTNNKDYYQNRIKSWL